MRRALQNLSFDEYDKLTKQEQLRMEALLADGLNGEDDLGVGDEEESPELALLDPKEWKVCALRFPFLVPRFVVAVLSSSLFPISS